MECPKCGNHLSTVPTSHGRGLSCCGTCCGAWFSKNELNDYLSDFKSGSQAAGDGPDRAAGSRAVLHPDASGGFCPKCNRMLERHLICGAGFEIAACSQCGGSFVGFDQLTLLERWYPDASPTAKTSLILNHPTEDPGIDASESFMGSFIGKVEDDNPVRGIPWFTFGLILINAICFMIILLVPDAVKSFYLIPKQYLENINSDIWPVLFCAFGHANPVHLAGNMYFLYVFGDNIEDRIGRSMYAVLYFFCVLVSSVSHVLVFNQSMVPMIGASGAISGIMGAYLYLYPRVRISVFSTCFWVPIKMSLPAWVYLLVWFFGSSVFFFFLKIPGIAWDAHASGFIAGYLGILLFKKLRIY